MLWWYIIYFVLFCFSEEIIPTIKESITFISLKITWHEKMYNKSRISWLPAVIFASPVSQPLRVAHSSLSLLPAAKWIAPSTEM